MASASGAENASQTDATETFQRATREPEPGFFSTTPGMALAVVVLSVAGYFGAAAATGRLGAQFTWVTAMTAGLKPGPRLDESKIAKALDACLPPRPADPAVWRNRRAMEDWNGNSWTVEENDPKSWIPCRRDSAIS